MQNTTVTKEYLDALYHQIGVCDELGNFDSYPLMRPRDALSVSGVSLIGMTRFGRHRAGFSSINRWRNLMETIVKLPPTPGLSILVTAMSIGCDLYDAVREAEIAGVFERHPNTVFYGHDYSQYFTRIAELGLYHYDKTRNVPDWHYYFEDSVIGLYMKVQDHIKSRVRILAPSDINTLKGQFDVVVSNIINSSIMRSNEAMAQVDDSLCRVSRHLAVENVGVGSCLGVSEEWESQFKREKYDVKLRGSPVPIQIPELYDPAKHAPPMPLLKNPASANAAGFDI